MDRLLTIVETAEFLRVKKATLYTWVYRRQIPSLKINGTLRFRAEDLQEWLAHHTRPQEPSL